MPSILKSGALGAKGGKRKGAGRPMNWQKRACEDIIRNKKLLPRLGQIAAGDKVFEKHTAFGQAFDAAADASVQVMATEKLMDRAWGKPRQEVEVSGIDSINVSDIFALTEKARETRGVDND